MSLATHRAAIVALLGGVADIGQVHAFERYAREESAFRTLYLYTPAGGEQQVRGWQVSNTAIDEHSNGRGRVVNTYTWRIRGFMSLADAQASELTFDALGEAVRAAYRADPTLGGIAQPDDTLDGIQKADAGPVLFCGVLCHSALLNLNTREYLAT